MGWLTSASLLACERLPSEGLTGESAPPLRSAREPAVVAPPAVAPAPRAAPVVAAEAHRGVTGAALAPVAEPVAPPAPSLQPPSLQPPSLCNEQAPQAFLVQAHFDTFNATGGSAREWRRVLARAVRYRTEEYGYVEGFGDEAWNASSPAEQARVVSFFGVAVSVHRRIAPALSCVETAIRARCSAHPYQPYVLSGLRKRNTYVNGEISNHVYGIAIDVDPTRNPCCGCIGPWGASERCQNEKTKFERMDMPRCWVTEFERFGFYWLGHEKIEDTMHFEFLAEPSRIARQAPQLR